VAKNRDLSKFPNAITVLDNGNVGIGTTSFSEGTQTTGTISIIPNSSVSSGPLVQFAGNGRIRPASTGDRLSIDGNALFLNSTFSGNIVMATGGGNVGIGVTSPSSKLNLIGGEFRWGYTSDMGALSYTDGKPMIQSIGAVDLLFYTNASEKLRITSGGSIGINATNPKWNYANLTALQIKNAFVYGYSTMEVGIGANAYYASGWKFIDANVATMYYASGNTHEFRNSTSSGTADAQITWSTPLKIDVNGYVFKDKQPVIAGQVGSTQSAGLASNQLIPFDDFWVSRGITYNSTTRRFTVPVAGVYRITMNPFFITGVGNSRVLVGINTDSPTPAAHKGSTYRQSAEYATGCINSIVTLAANDYVTFCIYQGQLYNGGASDAFNQFTIELIG
jgi:hypothetical protein